MKKTLNFILDEDGQGMIEYGLVIGLVAVVAVVILFALGPKIREKFSGINDNLK